MDALTSLGITEEELTELREAEVAGLLSTATISRDDEQIASDVGFTVLPAAISVEGYRLHAAVAGLGSGRASHIGYMPWGTDVRDGDTITCDGRSYAVAGVGWLDTVVGLALSEYGRP